MSQKPIRVIRIIARLNVGGPAKHVVWLTRGLAEEGFESLLVAGTVPAGEEDMGYFAEESGVAPLFIPEMSREISPKDALTIWKLFRLFLRERPNIVHTHTAKAGTVGRSAGLLYRWFTPGTLIGRPRRCKFVHTYHGHIFHSYYGPLKTRVFILIEKFLARLATDRILVVSEQQRREISEQFRVGRKESFTVVPLGLDLTAFGDWESRTSVFRRELNIPDDVILVGIVGRLTEIKNHELFIRAVARFKELWSDESGRVQFAIIGDGSLRKNLEELVQSLDLKGDVIFTGSRKDPENFYPALDVVALTSHNEGTPLTLIEAMANARAVIATSVGGVVDLLGSCKASRDGYKECERGFSVEPGDHEAFARGLIELVRNDELRREFGLRGFEFVQRNHRKERLLEDIKRVYAELLTVSRGRVAATEVKPGLHPRL